MKTYEVTYRGIDFIIKGSPVHEFGSKVLYDIEVYLEDPDCDISELIDEDVLDEIVDKAFEEESK